MLDIVHMHNTYIQMHVYIFTRLVLHERTASGSHQAEHRESVYDEAHLLVGQQRVDEDEAHGGQQQQPHPPVEEAERDKEQRAAQSAGHSRVKVPQKGRGLLGRRESRKNWGVEMILREFQ